MKSSEFVVCISNEGYEASLEPKKIYEVVADSVATSHTQIRIIDESGQDYLYPSSFFVSIELPASLRAQLSEVA